MFENIVRFSIKKKLFVALTTLFLIIGGIYSALTLPIDAMELRTIQTWIVKLF